MSVAIVGAASAAIMVTAAPAGAAPTPTYHAGLDTATFAVTGVLDNNCLVSIGGTEVWIKPGDSINFNSALLGINVAQINLLTGILGTVAGLNVDAAIDANTTHAQYVSVLAGRTTLFPRTGQSALTTGDHTLAWTAKSVTLLPILGSALTVPLSSSALQAGASLSWRGVIHVTNNATQCKIGVATPQVAVSVGPVKVTVPPINVNVPAPTLPNLPGLPGGGSGGGGTGGGTTPPGTGGHPTGSGGGVHYIPPPLTVPEQAMGGIGGGGGGFEGVRPDANGTSPLGTNLPQVPVAGNAAKHHGSANSIARAKVITKQLDLASNKAPAAQLPVLLAIIAIIALSLVTATYARLYLLRRN